MYDLQTLLTFHSYASSYQVLASSHIHLSLAESQFSVCCERTEFRFSNFPVDRPPHPLLRTACRLAFVPQTTSPPASRDNQDRTSVSAVYKSVSVSASFSRSSPLEIIQPTQSSLHIKHAEHTTMGGGVRTWYYPETRFSKRCIVTVPIASASSAQILQYRTQSDVQYSFNVPTASASSGNGDIYFQIQAPASTQWVGLGQGSQMRGANIFIVYSDSDGQNVTLSPRLGQGNFQPQFNSQAQVSLLEGSGISNGLMTANVRCTSISADI